MNRPSDFSPDPLLEFPDSVDFDAKFDNSYTAPYKFSYAARSPLMCVVAMEQTSEMEHPYSTYALQILPYITEQPLVNHGNLLVEIDIRLTNNSNTVKKDFFLYDYARVLYQVHGKLRIDRAQTVKTLIESVKKYYQEFGFYDPGDPDEKYIETMALMYRKFRYDLVLTNKRYHLINKIQTELSTVNVSEWFQQSDPKILTQTYRFNPMLINGVQIDENYGDLIFDNIKLSDRFPYLVFYDTNSEPYTKIYTELASDSSLDYGKILSKTSSSPKPNTIEFILWLGEGSLYNTSMSSFFAGTFDLTRGIITYSVPITLRDKQVQYSDMAQKVLANAFSDILLLGDYEIVMSQMEFNLYPLRDAEGKFNPEKGVFNFEEFMLLHEFTLNDMFRHMVYPDETIFPYFKRSRLEFSYIPMFMRDYVDRLHMPVTWSMTLRKTQSYISYNLSGDQTFKGRDGNFLRMKIVNADHPDTAREIITILVPLLCIFYRDYVFQSTPDRDYYISTIGYHVVNVENAQRERKFKSEDEKGDEKSTISREGATRLKEYSRKYPEIFQDRFKILCRSHKTPIIFDNEEEAKQWTATRKLDYIPYPYSNPAVPSSHRRTTPFQEGSGPLFWFASQHSDYKYPNVVANEDPDTYKILPYYPCTSKSDMRKPDVNSDYTEFYLGKKRIFARSAVDKSPKKVLNARDYGKLEPALDSFLSTYRDGNCKIVRYGCCHPGSKNSLIHCILYAVRDVEYVRYFPNGKIEGRENYMKLIIERERYVKQVRSKLSSSIHISLLAQELYDLSHESRKSVMNNIDSFMDPSLFYRAFEELYKINIFVFSKDGYEIPRHRDFSVRHYDMKWPCVLLYKNTESKIPNIELIVDRQSNVPYFDASMTEKCSSVHNMMLSTLTIVGNNIYSNIYSRFDYLEIFSGAITEQYIDGHGKSRGINVTLKSGKVTVYTHPGQPLNVPATVAPPYKTTPEIAKILFGKDFTYVTLDMNGMVNGLWYSALDIDQFFYVMLSVPAENKNYKIGRNYVPSTSAKSEISGLIEQERTLSIIIQLVIWTFDVYRLGMYKEDIQDIDIQFCSYVLTSLNSPVSSVNYYGFEQLHKILPKLTNYQSCLKYINLNTRNLVLTNDDTNYYFVFHSKIFRDKIVARVRTYYKNTYRDTISPRTVLDDYRTTHESFKQQEGVQILIGEKSLKVWMTGVAEVKKSHTEIYTKVTLSMSGQINPYLYSDEKSDLYLIQNIEGEYLKNKEEITEEQLYEKALKIALKWRMQGINSGYYYNIRAKPSEYKNFSIVTYMISKNGRFIPVLQTGPENVEYLSIIKYANYQELDDRARYAAMLPL